MPLSDETPELKPPALLPCPHCGGTDISVSGVRQGYRVSCSLCGAGTEVYVAVQGTAAAWNRRADSAELSALRAELAAAREALDCPSPLSEDCSCARCCEAKDRSAAEEKPCENCGYVGRFNAVECACYEMSCRGGDARGTGCSHGSLTCPVCEDGDGENGWDAFKRVRAALAPRAAGEAPQ